MELISIKTKILLPPDRDLIGLIQNAKPTFTERDIIVIASKVVALAEGRVVSRVGVNKDDLVRAEADLYVERDLVPDKVVMHAIIHGQLAVFAGIDSFGIWYVLWPKDPMESAEKICQSLKEIYGLKELGVIISDSKSTPLRRGVVGGAIGWAGFDPLYDNRKRTDLTGRPSGGSQINVADAVAAAAVLVMGEGMEQTPLVVARGVPYTFVEPVVKKLTNKSYQVPLVEDIFAPFFNTNSWQKGLGGK